MYQNGTFSFKGLKMIEKVIREIGFHDLPVESLKLYFDKGIIELVVNKFCDKCSDYNDLKLIFKDVRNIQSGNLPSLDIQEITDCTLEKTEKEYSIKFTMLLGFSEPSWNFQFIFKDLEKSSIKECSCPR